DAAGRKPGSVRREGDAVHAVATCGQTGAERRQARGGRGRPQVDVSVRVTGGEDGSGRIEHQRVDRRQAVLLSRQSSRCSRIARVPDEDLAGLPGGGEQSGAAEGNRVEVILAWLQLFWLRHPPRSAPGPEVESPFGANGRQGVAISAEGDG